MTRIGILSDTHNYLHPKLFPFFEKCDVLWHAGDFGNITIADELIKFKPLIGVYGNIDGNEVRKVYPKNQRFLCENVDVWITHIGGYPYNYDKEIKNQIIANPPRLFVCGHSHILKVVNDKKLNLLHINPGAAGKYGFHLVITAIRFEIDGNRMQNLEILELQKNKLS